MFFRDFRKRFHIQRSEKKYNLFRTHCSVFSLPTFPRGVQNFFGTLYAGVGEVFVGSELRKVAQKIYQKIDIIRKNLILKEMVGCKTKNLEKK